MPRRPIQFASLRPARLANPAKTNTSKSPQTPLIRASQGSSRETSYKGFPHGMPTTHAETINADLLAFIKS
jgi:hypothetical protein